MNTRTRICVVLATMLTGCAPDMPDPIAEGAAERYADTVCKIHDSRGCMGLAFADLDACKQVDVRRFHAVAAWPKVRFDADCFEGCSRGFRLHEPRLLPSSFSIRFENFSGASGGVARESSTGRRVGLESSGIARREADVLAGVRRRPCDDLLGSRYGLMNRSVSGAPPPRQPTMGSALCRGVGEAVVVFLAGTGDGALEVLLHQDVQRAVLAQRLGVIETDLVGVRPLARPIRGHVHRDRAAAQRGPDRGPLRLAHEPVDQRLVVPRAEVDGRLHRAFGLESRNLALREAQPQRITEDPELHDRPPPTIASNPQRRTSMRRRLARSSSERHNLAPAVPIERAALILAGGRSRRMGRPKAWLPLGDVPLLVHVVDQVSAVCQRVVVVGSPDQSLPPLPDGTLRVDDPPERRGQGPLPGLSTGLDVLASMGIASTYVGAVDMPFSTPEHVAFVLDLLEHEDSAAVVPHGRDDDRDDDTLHGLAGAVRVTPARDHARALLHTGRRSLHALYESLDARRIPIADLPDPRVVRACNTPEDWARARRELTSSRHPSPRP